MTREREVWGHLEHPNITPLYGYTEESKLFGPFGALISPVKLVQSCQGGLLIYFQWYSNGDSAKFLEAHGLSLSLDQRKDLVCYHAWKLLGY